MAQEQTGSLSVCRSVHWDLRFSFHFFFFLNSFMVLSQATTKPNLEVCGVNKIK